MRRNHTSFDGRWALVYVVVLAGLAACDDGIDEGGGDPGFTYYEVFIDSVASETTSGVIELRGTASCDACPPSETWFGACPPIQGPFPSAIGIRWSNLTSGESGDALHAIYGRQSWFFSYCTILYSHRWSASIPLAYGPNELELTASGPSSLPGRYRIQVTRMPAVPEYVATRSAPGEVVVSWSPVPGADLYEVLWSTEPDLALPGTNVVPVLASPFVHADLEDDLARYYAVRTVAQGYAGPSSSVVLGTAGWSLSALPVPDRGSLLLDAALAIDSHDALHVHLSRPDTGEFGLYLNDYATDAGGTWSALPVADVGALAADIAIDADDTVQLAYLEIGRGTLARRTGDTWSTETFAQPADCQVGLRLEPLGHAQVLYQVQEFQPSPVGRLQWGTDASGAWTSEIVDRCHFGCYQYGARLELELDEALVPHALYLGEAPALGLRYAKRAGGAWSAEQVAPGFVGGLALALDTTGAPHVAWTDDVNTLHHAWREAPGVWTSEEVDRYALAPSLAMDAQDTLHLSYVHYVRQELCHARRTNGTWRLLPVAHADAGDTALAVTAEGRARIVYSAGARVHVATQH